MDDGTADLYEAIARRHGLAVPTSYRDMAAAGWFDCFGRADWRSLDGAARVNLIKERALAGRLLFLPQVEWYPLDEIRDFTPGTWADGLLPFAGNGAGDH